MQVWIGADWDKDKCVVAYTHDDKIRRGSVQRDLASVKRFVGGFDGADLEVGIESGDALWAGLWRVAGAKVIVFDGKKAKRFGESLNSSRASDDKRSAHALLAMVQSPQHRAAANAELSDALKALDTLLECNDTASVEHTRHSNRLTSLIRQYHPAFASMLNSVDTNWVVRLLELAPTPNAWNELTKEQQDKALTGARLNMRAAYAEALGNDYGVVSEAEESAVRGRVRATVVMFKAARKVHADAERDLEQGLADHESASDLRAIDGIGNVVGAGLVIALCHADDTGGNRDTACKLLATVPVTIRSGTLGDKAPIVAMRRSASSTMKKIGHYLGTQLVRRHGWAKAAYAYYLSRGKTTFSAYRRIARSFIRVLRALRRDGTAFDEARYIKTLKEKNVEWALTL